jgi:hypothetical protein
MRRRYPLFALLVLALGLPAIPAFAQSGDYPYSIMRPEPGSRPVRQHAVPKHTAPHRIVKRTQKHKAARGSSNPVYPTLLPAPQNLTVPPPQQVVTPHPPAVPPAIFVPETGRMLPNLPTVSGSGRGGAETYQDRAARCAHQAGVYGDAAGNRNAYVGGCINQ